MRDILFRGKRADNGEWIYGRNINKFADDSVYMLKHGEQVTVIKNVKAKTDNLYGMSSNSERPIFIKIVPETVGQYTCCFDKSKTTKVFEGDIVWDEINEEYGVVEFDEGEFAANFYGDIGADRFADVIDCCYVCGNIYDNPELLTNEKEK